MYQVAKGSEFQLQHQSSNEHPGLISFRMDWLNLLAVQVTLKSLLQHHSSKASILRHSAFFIVQLSHPYMTTGKIIALTRRTFVDKVMSLLFNMLSRLDFPGGSDGKAFCLQCRRPGFNPCFRKIPWRRNWQPTPVFLPGKSHGWKSLVGYSPWGRKELDTTERLSSRLVITSLPRSKHLLISWLQSSSAVIMEPRKINSATVSTDSPSTCHEVIGLDTMI